MNEISQDFVSHEKNKYKFSLGKILASSLSGFIAGIIVAVIVLYATCNIVLK